MILNFEYYTSDEKIEIHADKAGLKSLRDTIDELLALELNAEVQEHFHLMVPEWGGGTY